MLSITIENEKLVFNVVAKLVGCKPEDEENQRKETNRWRKGQIPKRTFEKYLKLDVP